MGAMSHLEELSEEEKMRFVEVTYRFLRTPSFLVRHFPLSARARITESSLRDALRKTPRRYDVTVRPRFGPSRRQPIFRDALGLTACFH